MSTASTPTSTRRSIILAGARRPSGASAPRSSPSAGRRCHSTATPTRSPRSTRAWISGAIFEPHARPRGPESLNVTERYRYVYKPLVFVAGLAPLVWLTCGAFGWFGASLGADPVKELEHECGKTALNFLLLTLAVTPVRNILGLPQLLRLRRMLGLFAFFYALIHFTIYVVLDLELNWSTLGADIAKRPYITIGFTALLLLVPLAATSTNGMMRRLGRRWTSLHRLVYVIAILGVWHFYWQVKRDVREPLLYAGILALLLLYRVVRAQAARGAARAAASARAQLTSTSRVGTPLRPSASE